MGDIQKKITFRAPVEKVWEVWTDVGKTPEWVEGVQSSEVTSPVKEGRGLFARHSVEIIDIHQLKDEMGEKTVAIDAFKGNELCDIDQQTFKPSSLAITPTKVESSPPETRLTRLTREPHVLRLALSPTWQGQHSLQSDQILPRHF